MLQMIRNNLKVANDQLKKMKVEKGKYQLKA